VPASPQRLNSAVQSFWNEVSGSVAKGTVLSIITFLWLMGVESGDWTQTKCDWRVCYMVGEEIWTDAKLSEQ
jgi:hypothetical protein